MIITPQELQQWMDNGKSFTVVDIRPEEHRNEFPLTGLNPSISDANSILETEDDTVLVCQFGIVTEGIIVEKNLENTFNLLGGVQAWIEFQSEKEDLSRWSRQQYCPKLGWMDKKDF